MALVVPCFNEEETLGRTMTELGALLEAMKARGEIAPESFALYVDDGSRDGTWRLLEERHAADPFCRAIGFAANAGHQNAVWAGMEHAGKDGVDCVISLDADLQDDIAVIPQMCADWREGADVVYGVRASRPADTPFKRATAHLFYDLMRRLGVNLVPDHADFRLVGRPALKALESIGDRTLFLRALFPELGFRSAQVFYERKERKAGESKYPLGRMLSFAWKGITAHSIAPLRLAGLLSLLSMLAAMGWGLVAIIDHFRGATIPGWTSLMIVILFLGSAQLFCLAMIGEYLGRIFTEVRHRPRYIINRALGGDRMPEIV